ncbi:hypothetical protein FRC19_009348 [Serendipita sp. 401]|nr:hypothetical protein FRC19_009348 [Serendipita sp. 401]
MATAPTTKKWIGDSFEVGKDILGLSTLASQHEEPPVVGRTSIADDKAVSVASPEGDARAFSEVLGDTTLSPGLKATAAETNMPDPITLIGDTGGRNLSATAIKSIDSSGSQVMSATGSKVGSYVSTTHLLAPPRTTTPEPLSNESTTSLSKRRQDIRKSGSAASLREAASAVRSALRVPSRSNSLSGKKKGKGKVTFPEDPAGVRGNVSETPRSEEPTASPNEVLTREPSLNTSAGAAARINEELQPLDDAGDVILRDRMLIRVLSTSGSISKYLDEQQLLEMPEVRRERATMWREYLVVWRKSSIELYEQYTITAKEWFTKHKHLAYKIPLIPVKTTVSIFSRVDMSFCITCPKSTAHSHLPVYRDHEDKLTTLIFICKTKSRSRSVDWVWRLWRRLGGEIPDSVEIRCPAIDARVSFPIPAIDFVSGMEGYRSFTRERVIHNCREQMSGIPEWDLLIESALKPREDREAGKLELCWRTESNLDWAWLQDDVNGLNRPWSVLFGVALMNPRFPSELELRVAEHFPTRLALGNDTVLREPPAIEGYLYRYKPETHLKDPIYLATHNSNIFFIPQQHAHPPQPPTAAMQDEPIDQDQTSPNPDSSSRAATPVITRASEVRRGAAQILNAKSFLDMRTIETVRRAEEVLSTVNRRGSTSKHTKSGESANARERTTSSTTNATTTTSHAHEEGLSNEGLEMNHDLPPIDLELEQGNGEIALIKPTAEDDSDLGGDEELDKLAGDAKQELKKRRSFELVLRNSEVIRFEAYSCKIAVEWVNTIRALVVYWTRRHRVDARLEMDIVHAMSGRTRFLVPRIGESVYPAPPPDPRDASPLLGRWWHWCVLEGCRSIIRAGRLFMRTGVKGQMRHYYFVLVAGHLIRFRLASSRAHSPRAMHSHAKSINLLDAFVTSGHFAALELDEGNGGFEPVPRRFQDGLETDDRDIDTLIIIRYRHLSADRHLEKLPQPTHADSTGKATSHAGITTTTTTTHTRWMVTDAESVPPLNSHHKLLVLRARSKLERDAWCWALNVEIERLVRMNAIREQAVRDDGAIAT